MGECGECGGRGKWTGKKTPLRRGQNIGAKWAFLVSPFPIGFVAAAAMAGNDEADAEEKKTAMILPIAYGG